MRRLMVGLAALVLTTVGCAQSEDPTVEPPVGTQDPSATAGVNNRGTKTFTTEAFSLELEQDDFYFKPTYIKAPGDATATVELRNEGKAEHTFTIDALNVDEEVAPGASKKVEVKLGTETRYEFYCRYHGDQGMRGAFMPH